MTDTEDMIELGRASAETKGGSGRFSEEALMLPGTGALSDD